MPREADQPQYNTFELGLEFLRANASQDNWLLHLETFDPHEPFFTQQKYKDLYPHEYNGPHYDWPNYGRVTETPEQIEHVRKEYAALVSMCDAQLGKVLDLMDELDLWKDTLLIVNTDHGFLLGEKGWWAKLVPPFYNEIARTPLFIWDPRCGLHGERRKALVQTIDIPATLLEFFGQPLPKDMQGVPLAETIAKDTPVRDAGLYGVHGAHVNVTDGRYIYMRAPAHTHNDPLYEYTLLPTHMNRMFSPKELQDIQLAEPFSFTKGCRTMKICVNGSLWWSKPVELETMLFDLEADPAQEHPIQDPAVEARMIDHLDRLMRENDAPKEQFERLGLSR